MKTSAVQKRLREIVLTAVCRRTQRGAPCCSLPCNKDTMESSNNYSRCDEAFHSTSVTYLAHNSSSRKGMARQCLFFRLISLTAMHMPWISALTSHEKNWSVTASGTDRVVACMCVRKTSHEVAVCTCVFSLNRECFSKANYRMALQSVHTDVNIAAHTSECTAV